MIDIVNAAAKYVIALVVVIACFYVISVSAGGSDNTQPWSVVTLIVGWLIRDSAANASTANVAKIAASVTPPTGG